MTQKEFEDRTKLKVFADGFDAIHEIYMACGDEMDKDVFCRLWREKEFRTLLDRVTYEKIITEDAFNLATSKIKQMQPLSMLIMPNSCLARLRLTGTLTFVVKP